MRSLLKKKNASHKIFAILLFLAVVVKMEGSNKKALLTVVRKVQSDMPSLTALLSVFSCYHIISPNKGWV